MLEEQRALLRRQLGDREELLRVAVPAVPEQAGDPTLLGLLVSVLHRVFEDVQFPDPAAVEPGAQLGGVARHAARLVAVARVRSRELQALVLIDQELPPPDPEDELVEGMLPLRDRGDRPAQLHLDVRPRVIHAIDHPALQVPERERRGLSAVVGFRDRPGRDAGDVSILEQRCLAAHVPGLEPPAPIFCAVAFPPLAAGSGISRSDQTQHASLPCSQNCHLTSPTAVGLAKNGRNMFTGNTR